MGSDPTDGSARGPASRPAPVAPDGYPILPPRPNRGPEVGPVERVDSPVPAYVFLALSIAVLVLAGLVVGRRRLRRRRPAPQSSAPGVNELERLGPRERAIAVAESLRGCITRRFGAAWAARTTEELAVSPELAAAVGEGRLEDLIGLLRAGDRAKFAVGDPGGPVPGVEEIRELREALGSS